MSLALLHGCCVLLSRTLHQHRHGSQTNLQQLVHVLSHQSFHVTSILVKLYRSSAIIPLIQCFSVCSGRARRNLKEKKSAKKRSVPADARMMAARRAVPGGRKRSDKLIEFSGVTLKNGRQVSVDMYKIIIYVALHEISQGRLGLHVNCNLADLVSRIELRAHVFHCLGGLVCRQPSRVA